MVANNAGFGCRQIQRLGAVAVPVVRPVASRNVVVPLLSRVAVPVVRPEPSRNVLMPFKLVVTVPVIRPEPSRIVVCCADAAVTNASRIVTHRAMALIGHSFRSNKAEAARTHGRVITRPFVWQHDTARAGEGDAGFGVGIGNLAAAGQVAHLQRSH